MRKNRRLLLTVALLGMMGGVQANDIADSGIFYDITSPTTVKAVAAVSPNKGFVDIPDTIVFEDRKYAVTEIADYAFSNLTDIMRVTIPETVVKGCRALRQLTLRQPDMLTIADGHFSQDNYDNVQLVVPTGMGDRYRQAEGWRNFKTITEQEVTGRKVQVLLHINENGEVKIGTTVYQSGETSISLPADEPTTFEILPAEAYAFDWMEHRKHGGIEQYNKDMTDGRITISNIKNGAPSHWQWLSFKRIPEIRPLPHQDPPQNHQDFPLNLN